jgi:hypothetical protein
MDLTLEKHLNGERQTAARLAIAFVRIRTECLA